MKRKIPVLLATLALAGLGAATPVTAAQAAPDKSVAAAPCDDDYQNARRGFFYAYEHANCRTLLGHTDINDSNWGNGQGAFNGRDTNRASSLLNKGRLMEVAVYNATGTDWGGGMACLARSEKYASNLNNNTFHNQVAINDGISSHRWVTAGQCNGHWAD
ncbi:MULTISPECIES: hypothetical protein [unclassified Streptomyces]|uniref:hypothetical protein n=1 Tax=unclassified Streptomyces TaxID=2593676 RepID=UPI002366A064|nr:MULTISPECIES: hypothetical protein [unclassified Streptomyces]MDF3139935.1 hypothetical protein [Streptomyces sp. T21Q-yed]WDF44021.1 hypothetical protein PBV52_48190 [Streptomyces sp. T12]